VIKLLTAISHEIADTRNILFFFMGFIITITFYSNRLQSKIPYLHVYVKMKFMNTGIPSLVDAGNMKDKNKCGKVN